MPDDRLPMVLVLLDGLGDRPQAALGGLTPSEAARTPVLDELARRGQSGVHLPLGPGRAPASEIAHWAMFGMGANPFCGRALLEALGHGIAVPMGTLSLYAALRPSRVDGGSIWITGRVPAGDDHAEAEARELIDGLLSVDDGPFRFRLHPLRRGEAVLLLDGPVGPISDSDPFFEDLHPWMAPLPLVDAPDPECAAETAAALTRFLRRARQHLTDHSINRARQARGVPAFDALTTKWCGIRYPMPTFAAQVGCRGGMLPTSPFYRGLSRLLAMDERVPAADMTQRVAQAAAMHGEGCAFVHVHTKDTDLAGHTKVPAAKVAVIERLDAELAPLLDPPFDQTVVVVTGDHATPSSHGVLHTGDPTPFVITAPDLRADRVERFGEQWQIEGWLGRLTATDVMPVMASAANRPRFLGARSTAENTVMLPDRVTPLTDD